MSKLLLLVALVCAVAYAQADAGTVQQQISHNCGEIPYFNVTAIVTGVCSVSGSSSSAYYFDSSNVYSISFYGKNCSSDSISTVQQFPTGCSKSVAYGLNWVTSGTSATLPFSSFPPSGFQVSSYYVNVSSSGAKATACSVSSGVNELKTASNVGYCQVRDSSRGFTTPSSQKGFCTSDGTMYGGVVFSDSTCTTTAYGSESPLPTGCTITDGVATAAPVCGSTPTFPSDLPTTSFSVYSDSTCKTLVSTTFLGSCFDSQSLTCGTVNGTDGYATYSYWSSTSLPSASADGSCPATVTPFYLHQVLGGTCVPFPVGQTKTYRMYSCSASGPGASASTASVSIIATLFAAVAAVFAVRSL